MSSDDSDQVLAGTAYERACSLLSRHALLPKLLVVSDPSFLITRTDTSRWKLNQDVQGIISALESKGIIVALVNQEAQVAGLDETLRSLGLDKIIIVPQSDASSLRSKTGVNASDTVWSSVALSISALRDLLVQFEASSEDNRGF